MCCGAGNYFGKMLIIVGQHSLSRMLRNCMNLWELVYKHVASWSCLTNINTFFFLWLLCYGVKVSLSTLAGKEIDKPSQGEELGKMLIMLFFSEHCDLCSRKLLQEWKHHNKKKKKFLLSFLLVVEYSKISCDAESFVAYKVKEYMNLDRKL